jgi:hypothetical protein
MLHCSHIHIRYVSLIISEKFSRFFVWRAKRLFYIRSKVFLYIWNLWILLFQMIYAWSFIFHLFMVKLVVYEKHFHLIELGVSSLMLTASAKISLFKTLLVNYIEKLNFRFSCFSREMKGRCLRHLWRANQALS